MGYCNERAVADDCIHIQGYQYQHTDRPGQLRRLVCLDPSCTTMDKCFRIRELELHHTLSFQLTRLYADGYGTYGVELYHAG